MSFVPWIIVSLIYTLQIIYASKIGLNVKTSTVNDILLNEYCNSSLDYRNHLQILCKMYDVVEDTFPLDISEQDTIGLIFTLESDVSVYNASNNINIWYTNFIVQKFLTKEKNKHGVKFSLMNTLKSIFKYMYRVEIHLKYEKRILDESVEIAYICNETLPNFQNFLIYNIPNTTCKLIFKINLDKIFSNIWAEENRSWETLDTVSNQLKQKYHLNNVTFTEMTIYFKDAVIYLDPNSISNLTIIKLEFPQSNFAIMKNYTFPPIPRLEVLNMTEGKIKFIEDHALDYITGLKVVDFSKNKLSAIPKMFYKSLFVNLTYLNLEENKPNNKKFSLSPRFLTSSPSYLKILRLSRNHVVELGKGSFGAFPHLQYLFLDHCSLTFIPEGTFHNLISLISLDLDNNNLETLPEDIFATLYSLQYLNLSNNHFVDIPARSINMALNFQYNLSYPRLKYLNLRNNQIKEFSEDLTDFSLLHSFDLSSNHISFFSEKILEILLKIDFVNLSSNSFYCSSCNLYYLHTWLNATDYRDSDLFICSLPIELTGKKLKDLNSKYEDCLDFGTDTTVIIVALVITILCFISILSIVVYYYRWYLRYFLFHFKKAFCNFRQEENLLQFEYDAFIAYCVTETKWVFEQLVPHLESEEFGLKLCIHDRDFLAGRNVTQNIIDSIDKSRKIVVLLSNCFMKSEWCMLEIHLAQHRLFEDKRDDLILIKMEKLNKDLIKNPIPYLLKTRTYLEWPRKKENTLLFWNRLKEAIKTQV
ncbi:toll-like receptor 2 type-1 [Centruroides vittatus]|uniref:toll-like receptor 2 type-1 n=1 Tax=Centruroides vittatus TaxID=120091 RepID=UPI00350EABD4